MNKEEYLKYLDGRAAESQLWATRLHKEGDYSGWANHSGSAWAFRLARMKAEELE